MAAQPDRPDQVDVAYLRVSSNEQRRKQTIRGQRAEVGRYLEYAGLTAAVELADDGVQGDRAFEQRPDGARLLALLAEGKVRTVVVLKIDRLGRSALEILRVVQAIDQAGARLISIKENIDLATPTGRFFLAILAAFAELERAWIRERTMNGRLTKLQAGKLLPTYKALYGYRWLDREAGHLEPDPLTAPVVVRVFAETVDLGKTLGAIAADLNADGIAGPGGGAWHRTGVRNLLRHPYYAGRAILLRYRGKTNDAHGYKGGVPRPEDEWLELPPGTVPALVGERVWALAQAAIGRNRERRGGYRDRHGVGLLRGGLARCAVCGRTLTPIVKPPSQKRGARQPYYACPTGHAAIGVAVLDDWAWEKLGELVLEREALVGRWEEERQAPEPTNHADNLNRQLADARRRAKNVAEEIAGHGGGATLRAKLAELEERCVALERAKADALLADDGDRRRRERDDFFAWAAGLADEMPGMGLAEKRRALERAQAEARVWPHGSTPRAELRLRGPLGHEAVHRL